MADTQGNNSLAASLEARGLKIGNLVKVLDGGSDSGATVSTPLYVDSGSKLAGGNFPFTVPLAAGATDTSFSVVAITGQATGSANELMHLTLVSGANATATIAGYYRVTVTDAAGVITTGAYYAPFYTLA